MNIKEEIHALSDEMLEKFTEEYINCQTTPEVLFTWHGGETLLRGLDFFRKAVLQEFAIFPLSELFCFC